MKNVAEFSTTCKHAGEYMDDVALNKAATIERCVQRVRDVYANDPSSLTSGQTRQDSIVLNLQRACEAVIDRAMHWVRRERLWIPQESRDAFDKLAAAGRLDHALGEAMKRMVGFRNVAVHDYTRLNLDIVRSIIQTRLDDLLAFASAAIRNSSR